MGEREMLELAARAAGIELVTIDGALAILRAAAEIGAQGGKGEGNGLS